VDKGQRPNGPDSGCGYSQRGAEGASRQGSSIHRVGAFREKPSHEVAERFVASGEYDWNSGSFVWKAATILNALRVRSAGGGHLGPRRVKVCCAIG